MFRSCTLSNPPKIVSDHETRMLRSEHFTTQMNNWNNHACYLSAFISKLGGSSRSWLCCTSKTSTEVLSSRSGRLVSWLCPASSFRRLPLQNKLCNKGQRQKETYLELTWDKYEKMNRSGRILKMISPKNKFTQSSCKFILKGAQTWSC